MKYVNKPVRKKDAMQLVTGQPVYMDDIAPKDCLIVKLLRSPHANAIVTSLNKTGCDESGRDRGDLYLGRYPAGREAVHAGRTDISGDESV